MFEGVSCFFYLPSRSSILCVSVFRDTTYSNKEDALRFLVKQVRCFHLDPLCRRQLPDAIKGVVIAVYLLSLKKNVYFECMVYEQTLFQAKSCGILSTMSSADLQQQPSNSTYINNSKT